jgi:alpha-1,6-mannosyltransferase
MTTMAIAVVGFVGSVLITRASYVVGCLPGHHLHHADVVGPERRVYQVGVAVLVLAWLALGRLALDRSRTGMMRRTCWATGVMALPLLVSVPVASQDVWAYLGQANVAVHGLDPYAVGPDAVPGPYLHAVDNSWTSSPSPYGPLWLFVCRLVVSVTQPHVWAGVYVLRGLAVAGLVVTGVLLVRLSRAVGGRPEVAVWLAVANPFTLLMLVSAVHNDAVMLPLMLGGATVAATRASPRALLVAAALVGAAGAIKVIALVLLPFLPLFWFRYAAHEGPGPGPHPALRRWVATASATTATGVLTVLGLGVVLGFGTGWLPHVGDGRSGVSWLSIPQQVGNVLHALAPDRVADIPLDRYPWLHPLGLVLLGVGLAAVVVTAHRRPPARSVMLALLLLVLASPAPRTWYLLWPLMFLAVDRLRSSAVVATAAVSATIVLWFPASVRPQPPEWALLALLVPTTALAALVVTAAQPAETQDA